MLGLDSKQVFWLLVIIVAGVVYLVNEVFTSVHNRRTMEDQTYKTIRLRELDVEVLKAGGTLPTDDEEEEYGHA